MPVHIQTGRDELLAGMLDRGVPHQQGVPNRIIGVAFMGQEDISPAKAPGNSPTFLGQLKQRVALVPVGTALPAGLPERGPLSLSATVGPAARPRCLLLRFSTVSRGMFRNGAHQIVLTKGK